MKDGCDKKQAQRHQLRGVKYVAADERSQSAHHHRENKKPHLGHRVAVGQKLIETNSVEQGDGFNFDAVNKIGGQFVHMNHASHHSQVGSEDVDFKPVGESALNFIFRHESKPALADIFQHAFKQDVFLGDVSLYAELCSEHQTNVVSFFFQGSPTVSPNYDADHNMKMIPRLIFSHVK